MHTYRHASGVKFHYNSDFSGYVFITVPVQVGSVARIESQADGEDYWEVEIPCAALADFVTITTNNSSKEDAYSDEPV